MNILYVFSLLRKARGTEKRERGRSRNRFGHLPNIDLYDSVEVDVSTRDC